MLTHKGVPSSGMLVVAARVAAHPRAAELSGGASTSRPTVMMIDTGARFSVVTETVMSSLGVAPIGSTDVRTSLQQVVERPVYRIIVGLEFEDEYGVRHPLRFRSPSLPVRQCRRTYPRTWRSATRVYSGSISYGSFVSYTMAPRTASC